MPMNNAFRDLWRREGYSGINGSAAVVPPPPSDFLRVYHLMPPEHAISNIALRRIKLAKFANLNDPFELLSANFRSPKVRAAVTRFKDDFGQKNGLLCFSGDWLSPALWSHYATNHTGICFGINLKKARARKIDYVQQRISVTLNSGGTVPLLDKKIQDTLLYTKSHHWAYEEEIRAVMPLANATEEGGLHFFTFDNEIAVAEIVLGMHCKYSVADIRKLVGGSFPGAVAFKARPAIKYFSMVPDEPTVP